MGVLTIYTYVPDFRPFFHLGAMSGCIDKNLHIFTSLQKINGLSNFTYSWILSKISKTRILTMYNHVPGSIFGTVFVKELQGDLLTEKCLFQVEKKLSLKNWSKFVYFVIFLKAYFQMHTFAFRPCFFT